ncbi:cytochrome b/b6 domain-containing protein [Desulfocurvibacter africanus]|uniref:cytochrome b/b6 domain-containing protein n=1 Tax=Desulfocurvibacter africanus TaxID=873 RepID=UPI0004113F6B|nr:cytochrome b/b6 domain-containing protein [Desulfocurvibacter africanus]
MVALREMLRPPEPVMRRHGILALAIHWLNAGCVMFLLATGLALTPSGIPEYELAAWPRFLHRLFASGEALLLTHILAGLTWSMTMLLLVALRPRPAMRFLVTVFTVPPKAALKWAVRDNLRFLRGRGPSEHRGRYTPGQRMYAQAVTIGLTCAAMSGALLALPRLGLMPAAPLWALPVHDLSVAFALGCVAFHASKKILLENRGVPFSDFLLGGMPRSRAVRRHGLRDFDRERKA